MAFNNLGLQEPSTVTARVATVTIQRGSTLEHQEILVLGDATSSNAVAQVTNAVPSTSAYGLAVRQVDAVQSAQSGAWTVRANLSSTGTDNPVTASQSGNWTVRANLSSTSADNPVTASQAGTWNIGTVTAVTGKVSVINSSAADLNVTVAGYSTTVNVSSVAGIVAVRPSDTNWASSAGFHFNSSGELLTVAAASAASTTVNVSSLAGRVGIAGYHASGSLVNVTDSTNNAINVNVVAGSAAGSTVATISRFQDSSNNGIAVADSVNNALRVNVVAGAAGGSTVYTLSRVLDSSNNGIAVADSVNNALRMTVVAGGSTTVNVSSVAGIVAVRPSDTNWASSAGFHFNSSGELLTVAAVTTSTTVNVSSLAGRVTVAPSDTNWASSAGFHFDSSGALQISGTITASASTVTTVSAFYDSSNVAVQPGDATNKALRVNVVTGGSTTVNVSSVAGVVQIGDKLGNGIESSTNAVGTNSTRRGLAVRPMLPLSTYASGQAASSGDVTVFTSVAGQSIYVYGVCLHWGGVMTTNTNQLVRLQDGNSTATEYMRWRFQVSAIGATTQPLQAFVAPPAYLFRTAAGTNLRINTASSGLSYSLQAWYE